MKGWEYIAEGVLWLVGKFKRLSMLGDFDPGNWPVVVLAMGVVGFAGWYMRHELGTWLNF